MAVTSAFNADHLGRDETRSRFGRFGRSRKWSKGEMVWSFDRRGVENTFGETIRLLGGNNYAA